MGQSGGKDQMFCSKKRDKTEVYLTSVKTANREWPVEGPA